MNHYIYDIEVYPNVFTFAVKSYETQQYRVFEFSNRLNELPELLRFLNSLRSSGNCCMVGFNNLGYDYPVIHYIWNNRYQITTPEEIYQFSDKLINCKDRFKHLVWSSDMIVPQVDLYKLNHFDNPAKSTGLKVIEFNLWAGWLQELPFTPGTILNDTEIDELKDYNLNRDIVYTEKFFVECLPMIEFRRELTEKFHIDFTNHNDSKIGGDYLTLKILESKHGSIKDSFSYFKLKKTLRQTPRESIPLCEIILPIVQFNHSEFNRVLEWFKAQTIFKTKDCFKGLIAHVNGFAYMFGTGGVHGCATGSSVPIEGGTPGQRVKKRKINPRLFRSTDTHVIIDVDVASYYPNLAIVNNFYPKHLGESFCTAYAKLYQERKKHPKGSMLNLLYKLALNGTYGNSNSEYSIFYDPQFTMSITVNGQLLLCMLAEQLQIAHTELEMIQINTDGLTVKIKRDEEHALHTVCQRWEKLTGLVLENVKYSKMLVKDVNNYAALKESDNTPKLKGKYEYVKPHHKNQSALVVPKIVEECFIHDEIDIMNKIRHHDDVMDFMMRTKIPRSSRLELGGEKIQNVSRYFISKKGQSMVKIMPPLRKDPTKERKIGIHVGWMVEECNLIHTVNPENINYDYYFQEAEKLLDM